MKAKICLIMAVALIVTCLALICGCAESTPAETTETTVQTTVGEGSTVVETTTTPETTSVIETTTKKPEIVIETKNTGKTLSTTRIDMTVYVPETTTTETVAIKYTMNPPPKREFPDLPAVPDKPDIDMPINVVEGNGGGTSNYLFSIGKVDSISADGTMTVTLAGNKIENAQKLNWTFIYLDFDGNLRRAGDSSSVALKPTEDIVKPVEKAIQDYKKAYDDYYTAMEYGMSDMIKSDCYAAADEAYQAYEAAKAKAVSDFLDGRFWGVENSPVYKYINDYKYTYQKEPEDVTFYFILKDGEYCVLVNTFFKA